MCSAARNGVAMPANSNAHAANPACRKQITHR